MTDSKLLRLRPHPWWHHPWKCLTVPGFRLGYIHGFWRAALERGHPDALDRLEATEEAIEQGMIRAGVRPVEARQERERIKAERGGFSRVQHWHPGDLAP